MSLHKKLKKRIIRPFSAWVAKVDHAWTRALRAIGVMRGTVEEGLKPARYPKGQWHRWYQAERKRQRQVANCTRRGQRNLYPPLKRYMVQ